MDVDLFIVLGWASPVGLGFFIVCASFSAWLLRKNKE